MDVPPLRVLVRAKAKIDAGDPDSFCFVFRDNEWGLVPLAGGDGWVLMCWSLLQLASQDSDSGGEAGGPPAKRRKTAPPKGPKGSKGSKAPRGAA